MQSTALRLVEFIVSEFPNFKHNSKHNFRCLMAILTSLPPTSPLNIPFQKKLVSSRASSAVDKEYRAAFRDRLFGNSEARPSTTHAFRVFTPPVFVLFYFSCKVSPRKLFVLWHISIKNIFCSVIK